MTRYRKLKFASYVLVTFALFAFVQSNLSDASWLLGQFAVGYGNGFLALNFSNSAKSRAQTWFDRPNGTEVGHSGMPEVIRTASGSIVIFPFWIPTLFAGIAAFYFHRKARCLPGYCINCGYNLAGNTTGVCPECGKRFPDSTG